METGDHSIFPVSFSAGTLPTGENEIALSSLNAEELKLSVGDTLDLNVNGKKSGYTVCGIYSDITNGGKTAKIRNRPDTAPVIWSVLYVSLKESTDKEQWMAQYRGMGVDVTDVEDYVQDTYEQTLAQLRLASRVAGGYRRAGHSRGVDTFPTPHCRAGAVRNFSAQSPGLYQRDSKTHLFCKRAFSCCIRHRGGAYPGPPVWGKLVRDGFEVFWCGQFSFCHKLGASDGWHTDCHF